MTFTTKGIARAAVAGAGALALLATAACGGGGQDSPEDLGQEMVKVFEDKDEDLAKELSCDETEDPDFDTDEFQEAEISASFKEVKDETDDTATVVLELTIDDLEMENEPIDFPIRKVDGTWCVD